MKKMYLLGLNKKGISSLQQEVRQIRFLTNYWVR